MATEFAHLHLHTEYSLLDGLGRIPEYINRAHEVGIQHVAVTDHGVMYASLEWYRQATKAGLHPIVGIEAYLAEGKASVRDRKSYHLLLLAENGCLIVALSAALGVNVCQLALMRARRR